MSQRITPLSQETADELNAIFEQCKKTFEDILNNTMTPNEFYMIYVEGQNSPTRKYLTFDDARKEAERLARAMHRKTYILGTIECLEVNDIIRTKCNVSELPF